MATKKTTPDPLRTESVIKEVTDIVSYIYDISEQIALDHPEEQYYTASRLRTTANDGLYYTAQALGNKLKHNSEYDWNDAHRSLFAMQSMYLFATKKHYTDISPEMVIRMDSLLENLSRLVNTNIKPKK